MKRRPDIRRIEVISDEEARIMRAIPPAERVLTALKLNRFARLTIEGHLRTIHPEWSDGQIQAEIARRMLLGTD